MKNRGRGKHGTNLPKVLRTAGATITVRNQKIPVYEILQASKDYTDFLNAYRQIVLPQQTRTIRLLGRKSPAKIINTLLGYEVQASYKRIQCPDLVTARYVRLFSELGCHSIQLPYDPTITAQLIPEFEAMVESIKMRICELFPQDSAIQVYAIQRAYRIIRQKLRVA